MLIDLKAQELGGRGYIVIVSMGSLSILQDYCIELVDCLLETPVFGGGHFP